MIFSLFIAETIIFRIKVSCKRIFSGNILSKGFPTELENYGNSRGWVGRGYDKHPLEWKFQGDGGSKTKVPSEGGMDIFWNYTLKF